MDLWKKGWGRQHCLSQHHLTLKPTLLLADDYRKQVEPLNYDNYLEISNITAMVDMLAPMYDNSPAWERFLRKPEVQAAESAHRAGLKVKDVHTIIPHRLYVLLAGTVQDTVELLDKEDFYWKVLMSDGRFTERFIEFGPACTWNQPTQNTIRDCSFQGENIRFVQHLYNPYLCSSMTATTSITYIPNACIESKLSYSQHDQGHLCAYNARPSSQPQRRQ